MAQRLRRGISQRTRISFGAVSVHSWLRKADMKLLYHTSPVPNFGDDINESIWDALAPGLLDDAENVGFLGIGTVVGKPFDRIDRLHVFSSGAGYDPLNFPSDDVRVWCVRGPITARLLNIDPSYAVTDGALLAPLVWPASKSTGQVVVIPHWQSLLGYEAAWTEACSIAGFKLVNPMQCVERVLEDISSASLVLTESLHGAILADAYGVEWKAWSCSSNFSLIKWTDWTASMDVPLSVSAVAAPRASIVKQLGRPPIAQGAIDSIISEEAVEREISARCTKRTEPTQSRMSPKVLLKRIVLSDFVGSKILGFHPAETAKNLLEIASSATPQLSSADNRTRLTQKLLGLLKEMSELNEHQAEASTTGKPFNSLPHDGSKRGVT